MPQDMKMVLAKAGLTPQEAGRLGRGVKRSFGLNKNRYCGKYCALWEVCWMKPFSKLRHNGKCALANMDDISKTRALNLVTGGKQGISNNINDLLISIEQDINTPSIDGKPKTFEKMQLLDKYMKWCDMLYGKEKEKVTQIGAISELKKMQTLFNAKDNTKETIQTTEQRDEDGNLIKTQVKHTKEVNENMWDEEEEKPHMGEIVVANKKGFWKNTGKYKTATPVQKQGLGESKVEPSEHDGPRDDQGDEVLSVT